MKFIKKLAIISSFTILTACSTSKVEQRTNPIDNNKIKATSQVKASTADYQEEEIIDFDDPNFDIEKVEYDSCCK